MRDVPMMAAVTAVLAIAACDSRTFQPATGGSATGTTPGETGGTSDGGPRLAAGASCASNQACASGVCGVGGAGNCCLAACSTGDPVCGAAACDDMGICAYPQPGVDCPGSCSGETLFFNSCNGSGHCDVQTFEVCPGNLACRDGGCQKSCGSSDDCAAGFRCNAGACVGPEQVGPCTEDDDCASGVCGIHGTGNCCSAACNAGSASCGATGCDASGACLYPDSKTACGSVLQSCTGHTEQKPSLCDGIGNCDDAPGTVDCSPFVCGATACSRTCKNNGGCPSGEFCDTGHSACCDGLGTYGSMTVDGVVGSDSTACCGIGDAKPCQTLTQALQLVDEAQVQAVTITATMNNDYGAAALNWTTLETYPIVLGWGVEIMAAGMYFPDPPGDGKVFDIKATSAADLSRSASIVGTLAYPVGIGMDTEGDQSNDLLVIDVAPGNTAYLANVTVNGSAANKSTAIHVNGGGSLVLGKDQSGDVAGPVTVGNDLGAYESNGYDGIVCGTGSGLGCTISDVGLGGPSSLVIMGQEHRDIDAEDYASISLTSAVQIGVAPSAMGFDTCPMKADASDDNAEAVLVHGSALMTFSGSVQCIAGDAFRLSSSASGVPSLTLKGSTLQNTERAIHASAGTASVSGSTIRFNYIGVEQDGDATHVAAIDLGHEASLGPNAVICSSDLESVDAGSNAAPGVCVLNTTAATLDATNVDWDTLGPDLFACGAALTDCSCDLASCTASPGADGMDAVQESTGAITTSGNGQSATNCASPAE